MAPRTNRRSACDFGHPMRASTAAPPSHVELVGVGWCFAQYLPADGLLLGLLQPQQRRGPSHGNLRFDPSAHIDEPANHRSEHDQNEPKG